jgi:hypothetical protein
MEQISKLKHYCLLECDTLQSGISSATIYRNLLPPSSRQKNEMSAEKRWYEYRDRDCQDIGSEQTNRSKKSKKKSVAIKRVILLEH